MGASCFAHEGWSARAVRGFWAGWVGVLVEFCDVCSLRWVRSAEAAPAADPHVLLLSASVLHVAWKEAQPRCGLLCALVGRCSFIYLYRQPPGDCLCFILDVALSKPHACMPTLLP